MTNANDLLVEIAELILGAADLVAEQERGLPALQPHPGGDSLGLTLLGYQAAMLLPPGRDVWPRIIAPDPQAQLRAAERLTRQAPITDFPYGMVAVIATVGDETPTAPRDQHGNPARHEGRLVGFLWVLDPDARVSDDELTLLVDCTELAAAALATTASTALDRRRRRAELIDILLTGPNSDAAAELARLEHLPHDVRIQVEAPSRIGGWPLTGSMSAHVVNRRPRTATSVAPVPLAQLKVAPHRAQATMQAVAAGAHMASVSFDSLGAWHLIVAAPPDLTATDLHPAVALLRAQPRQELLITARVVLDHGGDVAAAAASLFVHRTTLYYRLDRILELTGVDLRQGHDGVHLQLALWLDDYRRVQPPTS